MFDATQDSLESLTKRPEGELSMEELESVVGGVNMTATDLLRRGRAPLSNAVTQVTRIPVGAGDRRRR